MNTFKFVGQIKKIEEKNDRKFIETKVLPSGWTLERVKFRMVCGDTSEFVETTGGKWPSDDKNLIYTYFVKKGNENEKGGEKAQVKWSDRFNPDIVDQVPSYKKYVVDLASDKVRRQLVKEGKQEEADALAAQKHVYISNYDFTLKVAELLNAKAFGDKTYVVTGDIEYNYAINKKGEGVYYRSFVPNNIYLATENDVPGTMGMLDFYYNKEEYLGDALENGDIPVEGYVRYYDSMAKGNYFAPTTIFLKNGHEKTRGLKRVLDMETDENIATLGAAVEFYSGSPKTDIKYEDLTKVEQDLIDWGVKTLEETISEKGGAVYEDRITRVYLVGTGKGDKAVPKGTDFTVEQLEEKPDKDKGKTSEKKTKKTIDLFDDDDEI